MNSHHASKDRDGHNRKSCSSKQFISLAELRPRVDLAGCYHFPEPIWFEYKLPHNHHFILIQTGSLHARTIDGEVTAGPRDLICFRPAPYNQYGVTAGTVYYQASFALARPPRDRLPLWIEPTGLLPSRLTLGGHFGEMRALFETLCLELGERGPVHELRVIAAVHQILALVVQIVSANPPAQPHCDSMDRVRLQLEAEPFANINVATLARESGLGTDHFIRQFKVRFGLTPKAYQTRVRIREAVRLLRETDLTVKQIALRFGWIDAKVLAGHMQRLLGRNPNEIRSGKPTTKLILPNGKLYPVNLHVIPPDAGPEWFDRWMLPGKRDVITQASAMELSVKLKR
jgi:AraC-like DNA-binding protein